MSITFQNSFFEALFKMHSYFSNVSLEVPHFIYPKSLKRNSNGYFFWMNWAVGLVMIVIKAESLEIMLI